jgi:hypothetical protein
MTFMFQGRSSVSWKWRMFRANKHQQNDRKCWKNSRTHPRAHRPRMDQLWSVPRDLDRKSEHAPNCREVYSPTLDKWSKAAANKLMSWAHRITGFLDFFFLTVFWGLQTRRFGNWVCFRPQVKGNSVCCTPSSEPYNIYLICPELREKANEDPTSIFRIITVDKIWIHGYNPETKQQWSQWKSS